jgi:MerR family transcriptional regulator, light-induced transcriptional regulator
VERLRLIKRLMDQGHRPGRLMAATPEQLAELAPRRAPIPPEPGGRTGAFDPDELLRLVTRHDAAGYQQALQQLLIRQGLQRLVLDTIAPLTLLVGHAWEQGSIEVFEEHLFTELTKRVLRQAIATLPPVGQRPRVVLTSAPDEQHALGLLMVEALLTLEGATCIPLGTQMPLAEIGKAAAAHHADIVALSFSAAFAHRHIPGLLQQLREMLPDTVELWAGGSGVSRVTSPAGVRQLSGLQQGVEALAAWRGRHAG